MYYTETGVCIINLPFRALLCIILASAIAGGLIEHLMRKTDSTEQSTQIENKSQNDVVTVVKETIAKDGTSQRETITTDRSTRSEAARSELKVLHSEPSPNWFLYGGLSTRQVYLMGLQRRILGNIYLGVYADTDRSVGASVGFQF